MYVNKKQILVLTPKLQSNFLFFMNICKTIDIFVVEYYNFQVHFIKIIIQNNEIKLLARFRPIFGSELNEKRSRAEPS